MFLNRLPFNAKLKWICLIIRPVRHGSNVPEYYRRLELPTSATTEEIKSSYYRLSKVYHPDLSNDLDAKNNFEKISEAYECLSNQELRQNYDSKHRLNSFNKKFSSSVPLEDAEFVKYTKFKRRGPIMKGRTSYFDYNEHFKSHYGCDSFEQFKPNYKKGDEYINYLANQRRTNRRIGLTLLLILSLLMLREFFKKYKN